MAHWSIAIDTPRAEPRVRAEKRLLVVGDERVRNLAASAYHRPGWAITACHAGGLIPAGRWNEVVVDANALDWVRADHPDVVRQAPQIWVVPAEGAESERTASPFANPLPTAGRLVKRMLDILFAFTGLVAVLPVLLLAMALVRFESHGPALFRQVRMGVNGRRFRLYKLRTMYHGNDDRDHREYVSRLIAGDGERCRDVYKLVDDPRITRVGRVLRKWSIDELPQLWNVLKGDMSLVGPRPPLPHETELYRASAWGRLRVKPGITGLWQVSGRCELSFDEMVSLDVRYWQRWSLLSDLRILLKTPRTVLSRRGAA